MPPESPDWIVDGLRQVRAELTAFVRALLGFSFRPRAFAAAWEAGQVHSLNPLGFLATALGVMSTAHLLVGDDVGSSGGVLAALLASALPFVHFALLGVIVHLMLRLFGSPRRLRDSLAMALYAGGPTLLIELIMMAVLCLLPDARNAVMVFVMIFSMSAFCWALATSLGELHGRFGVRWWHLFLAIACAFVVLGFAFGSLNLPGRYGLHFVIAREPSGWSFGIGG